MFGAKKDPRVEKLDPVQLARSAKERGDVLLQVQMAESPHPSMTRGITVGNGAEFGPILSEIEQLGWRSEHMSTTYVQTTPGFPGQLVLVYVFRNTTGHDTTEQQAF